MKIVRLNSAMLREALLRYGSDTKNWPNEFQALARLSSHNPEFQTLIEKEKQFEEELLSRTFESARPGLAERIITAATTHRYIPKQKWEVLYDMPFMKPAAFAAMLVVGFALGFSTLERKNDVDTTPSQVYNDDI